jgi:hypothetical protein
MTREEFERLKEVSPHKNDFGTITELDHWPVITLTYSLDGLPPVIHGRKEVVTIVTPEGSDPELGGIIPYGEVSLSKEEVEDIPGWVSVERKIKEALEEKWQAQQEMLAQANPPPTPEVPPE